jgi:hypothetical protein
MSTRRRWGPAPWALLAPLAVVCGWVAACGPSEPETDEPASASAPTSSGPAKELASGDQGSDARLFEERRRTPSAATQDNRRRRDPAVDGWRSEVLHDQAKKAFKKFLHAVVHPNGEAHYEEYLDPAFEGATDLRPADLSTLLDDGATRTLRAEQIDPDEPFQPAGALAGQLADAMKPFAGAEDLGATFKIVKVDVEGGRFDTTVLVEIDGLVDGAPIQQNSSWRVGWTEADEEHVRLRFIRLLSYDEVRTKRGLFGEHTRHLFGGNDFWDQEFRLGISDYYFKLDKMTGNAFIGGQGLAVGDVDGDGLDDLYVCQQGGLPNRLFLHDSDGTAVDVAEERNVAFLDNTRGALIVDLDNDGHQDLALAMRQDVLVCFGDGKGDFPPEARVLLPGKGDQDVFSITVGDADLDGDLDVYGCRYVKNGILGGVPVPYHDADNGSPNLCWRNDGERKFELGMRDFGLMQNNTKFSLASIWEDFDGDGKPDIYVTNDFGRNNLYKNMGHRFRDVAVEAGADDMAAGMGAASADVDLDGHPDILVTNMFSSAGLRIASISDQFMGGENEDVHKHYVRHARGNTLLCNKGDGTFEDVTEFAGIAMGRWGWGARFVDLNNDGLEDIYVPNGFITNQDPEDM